MAPTGLGGGQRVPKDSLRVGAYGAVDELNSAHRHRAVARARRRASPRYRSCRTSCSTSARTSVFVGRGQSEVQAAADRSASRDGAGAHHRRAERSGGPARKFRPAGRRPSAPAHLQLARTICRRAERDVIALSRLEPIGEFVVAYLNRLSDALFVMGRYENKMRGVAEPLWNTKL